MKSRTMPTAIDKLPVSVMARYILGILFHHERQDNEMPSKAAIAQYLNVSKQTVYKAFKELVDANFIEVESTSGKKDKILVKINFI